MAELVRVDPDARTVRFVLTVIGCTLVPILLVAALTPLQADDSALSSLLALPLFMGSSMHVASTAWFYSQQEVRTHMRRHPRRYVVAPVALVVGAACVLALLPNSVTRWVLLAFFAWQFVHFQKQNLGMTALVARARGVAGPTRPERRALVAAGAGGVLGLLGHPALLQVDLGRSSDFLFVTGALVFATAVVAGAVAVLRRDDRDGDVVTVYALALLFFLPVWLFDSPYAAVAGLTIAHGLQYLVLMTMVASGSRDRTVGLLVLLNVAVLLGVGLMVLSHEHGHGLGGQALFGAFLGLSMSHFVIDAGLWRLRDEFPRRFLGERLPYLLAVAPSIDDHARVHTPTGIGA